VRDTWGQGTGRHTQEQVESRLCEAIDAVSTQLGAGPYFLGERPRVIDATVHAFMWSMLDTPFESSAAQHARSLPNVVAYCARMRQKFFATGAEERARARGLSRVGSAA
jgi:glutathione S-transferase